MRQSTCRRPLLACSSTTSSYAKRSCWSSVLSSGLLAITLMAMIIQHIPKTALAAPTKLEMHAGTQLNPDTFQSQVANGIWLVEHYSPFCHHCKDFAPTWIELANSRKHQEETINFHFGQVDCSVFGDLCDKNNVKGYPSIFLYENGDFVEQFRKERTMERLNKWLDARLPDEPAQAEIQAEDQAPLAAAAGAAGAAEAVVAGDQAGSEVDDDTAEDPEPARHLEDEQKNAEAQRTASSEGNDSLNGNSSRKESVNGNTAVAVEDEVAKATPPAGKVGDLMHNDGEPPLLQIQKHNTVHKRVTPNPEGQVKHLRTSQLEAFLSPDSADGPVFVKYYAPWCGHCKKLAPTWSELAGKLRNRVNVVEFNCDASENKAKCRAEGITGYPTLVFYQGGEKAEYRGARGLSQMEDFANKAVMSTGLRDLDPSELIDISKEDEVFFLYLYPSHTPASEVELIQTVAGSLMGAAPVFKSSSPELFGSLGYPEDHPSLLVFKDHELLPRDSLNFTDVFSTSTSTDLQESRRKERETLLARWIHTHKFPTLTELTGANFKDYMEEGQLRSPSFVALAAIDPVKVGTQRFEQSQRELLDIGKAWQEAMKTINVQAKPVHFVWVDADKWAKYLTSMYNIAPNRPEPLIILTDPASEKYYPMDLYKRSIRIDQAQIFEALGHLYDGRLKAVRSTSLLERFGRWMLGKMNTLGEFIGDHPLISIFSGVVIFLSMLGLLVYYMDNEELTNRGKAGPPPFHKSKYVHNEKSIYGPSSASNGVKKD